MSRNPNTISQSRHQRRESRQETSYRLGKAILKRGYHLQQSKSNPYHWIVTRPNGAYVRTASGDYVNRYNVRLGATEAEDTCDCDGFCIIGEGLTPCSHLWGIRLHGGAVIDGTADMVALIEVTPHPAHAQAPTSPNPGQKGTAPPLAPGTTITTAGGRTAQVRHPKDYGRSRWARNGVGA